jgi:hypothetical protein
MVKAYMPQTALVVERMRLQWQCMGSSCQFEGAQLRLATCLISIAFRIGSDRVARERLCNTRYLHQTALLNRLFMLQQSWHAETRSCESTVDNP